MITPTDNRGKYVDVLGLIKWIMNWADDLYWYISKSWVFTKYFLPFPSLVLDGDISSEVTDELYVPASEPRPIDPDPSSELSADWE